MALEHIMESMKDSSFSESTNSASAINEDSLKEMMRDERYWKAGNRDANFIRQVEDGFKKLYG